MRLLVQFLLLLFIIAVHGVCSGKSTQFGKVISDDDIRLSTVFGGSGGTAFSDVNAIKFGQTLSSITIAAGERVDAVTLQVATPAKRTFSHGGSGGTDNTLVLADGEYITSMEVHWGEKRGDTRVFYLRFGTSAGNFISGGTATEDGATVAAPNGFQLSGFFGRCESEIDQLGVIWTRMSAASLSLTDEMGYDWYGVTIRNWVGPTIGDASDTACYRKTEAFGSNGVCPLGYSKQSSNCIAQCPLSYPVVCFGECIPQNDDCALEVLSKVTALANTIFNTATAGVFGEIFTTYQNAKRVTLCAGSIISLIRSLVYYLRFHQTTAPGSDVEQLLAVAYQSDVVIFALPIAVCNCLGITVPTSVKFSDTVLQIVEAIVKQSITNGEEIVSSAVNVLALLTNTSAVNSTGASVDELQELIDSNSSCGYRLKNLTDYVVDSVVKFRSVTPGLALDEIRVKISNSSLVVDDIPTVTNNCMKEVMSNKTAEAAFKTRDLLRKTLGVIIDQLINSGMTDMGESVAKDEYMLEVTNMGLTALAGLDPSRIVWLLSQFVQPTCGPTAFIGEIDDGMLSDALGLTTVDEAFAGSYGTWTKKGDGVVNLIFESTDTKDVTVVIHSGGEKVAEIDVDEGKTVTWSSTILELRDKTLYLDRWRPNAIGIPRSGGGSLVLWVPRSSDGGHLTMHVRINIS